MTLPFAEQQPCRTHNQDIEIPFEGFGGTISWTDIFGNTGPVDIEIGCGKGRYIIAAARCNPRINYFGIERSAKYFNITKTRALKAGLPNIRLLSAEAGFFVQTNVPDNSVQSYHIYFPDPWPKKRHNKRRLVNPLFVNHLHRTLIPGGKFFFATDFVEYFNVMVSVAGACAGLRQIKHTVLQPGDTNPEEAPTNYERKYLLEGRHIFKAAYEKG